MQEGKDDKDDDYVNKINQYINNPPTGQEGAGGLPGGLDQNAMLQMFGGGRPSGSSSSTPQAPRASPSPNVGVTDLQSILTGMGMPGSTVSNLLQQQQQRNQRTGQASSSTAPTSSSPSQSRTSLSQVINADAILPLLSNPAIQAQLLPFLPEERRTPEELRELLRSPQFQQSLESFSSALQSGQLGELTRQFGLGTNTGAPTSVEGFLSALQSQAPQQPSSTSSGNKDEKKEEKKDEKKDDKKDEKKDKKDDDKMDTN